MSKALTSSPSNPATRLLVDPSAASSRRGFVRTLGLAAGIAGVGTLALGEQARADGVNNTFQEDQTFLGRVGIGVTPLHSLHVESSSPSKAVKVISAGGAIHAEHDHDWAGGTVDLVSLFHKSTGDGVFVAHQGGRPPGYAGEIGGNASVNLLIPYHLDDTTTGRQGSITNDRVGMKGLAIQTQTPNDGVTAVSIDHAGNSPAIYVRNQNPNYPQGAGAPLVVDDYSEASSITVGKWEQPAGNSALLVLQTHTNSAIPAIRVADQTGNARALLRTDGTLALGVNQPFAVRLQAEMSSSGISRNVALSNGSGVTGSGVQIEFDDDTAQFALISAVFESNVVPRAASLRFSIRAANRMTEQLRLADGEVIVYAPLFTVKDGTDIAIGTTVGMRIGTSASTKLGFMGATPVSRQTLGAAAVDPDSTRDLANSLRTALINLGLCG